MSTFDESLALLLLPTKLEEFELQAHARELLAIPRVVALEPSKVRTPRFMLQSTSLRQARRLRLPGRPRMLILYHPAQYPLANALAIQYEEAELWYIPPDLEALGQDGAVRTRDLLEFDEFARERAERTLSARDEDVDTEPIMLRMRELDVINARAFVPGRRPPPPAAAS